MLPERRDELAGPCAELFEGMLEGFAHCRMLYDRDGRRDDFEYLLVNPAFGRLTGLHDVVGRRVTELLPGIKEQNPELFDIYGAVAETGEPAEFDIDFGPLERWLHVSATRPREGEFVAFFYDITPRVAAEIEAREATRRLELSLAAAGAGIWEWDVATGANTWSSELWGLYDLDPGAHAASFESWLGSVLPEDRERLLGLVTTAAAQGSDLDFEWQVATRDGSVRWLLSRGGPVLGDDGHPVVYRGVVMDVTERKRVEQALEEREEAYAAIFQGSPYAMALMTRDSVIVNANQAFRELIGAGDREIAGESPVSLGIASEDAVARIVAMLDRDGAVRDLELERATMEGVPFVVSMNLTPVTVGGHDHVLAIYRDITERRRAEREVQEGRAKLEAALASMTDAVFISDADGNFVEFNDAFATFHRFATRDDCLRSLGEYPDILEVYLDTGEPAPLDMWAVPRALRGETVADAEYGLRRKDTGEEWIGSYSFGPIRNEEGVVVGSVVVGRDVTERKKAERDLAESSTKFRALFEHTSIGVFLTDPGGVIEAANPAAQAMFGYTEEEFRALGRDGIMDQADGRVNAAVAERDLTGRVQAVELIAVRKGGERFPVEVDSTIIPGPPARSFVLMRDISWRKEAELALAAREAEAREMLGRLSRAQALGHMGDWAWDVASGRVSWSPEVYEVFGLGPDALTTFDSIVALVHEGDRAVHLRRVDRLMADPAQTSATFGFRVVRPDGEVREVNQTVLVERDAAGAPVRMYGLIQDVTELRRIEQALVQSEARLRRFNLELEDRVEQRTEQLKKANEELEAFSYSVSHDLRAPLRHISGYSQLLVEQLGDDLDADARHFLDVIVASAREMGDLIDDLLQLSRLGRVDLHVGVVDMGRCVQEALALLQSESHERVTVRVSELPAAFGDHTLLRQVWVNLLENAFKYAGPRDAPAIEVGALEEDGETVFFVRDNGVGFDMAYADKLFAVFQRLHSSGEFQGTGIGLATVHRLVDRHGGRVWAQAAVDEGATFFFTVPGETGGLG